MEGRRTRPLSLVAAHQSFVRTKSSATIDERRRLALALLMLNWQAPRAHAHMLQASSYAPALPCLMEGGQQRARAPMHAHADGR
jgi:hypothetical protein